MSIVRLLSSPSYTLYQKSLRIGPVANIQQAPPPFVPDFYISPSGGSGLGVPGTIGSPWSLPYALTGANGRLVGGRSGGLLGGTYSGAFISTLNGALGNQVVIRQVPGNRAIIDGHIAVPSGSYVRFQGFEVFASNHSAAALGINVQTPGIELINIISHDATMSGIYLQCSLDADSMVYGCICYNNGDHSNQDHGVYAHTVGPSTGTLLLQDNVTFNNYAYGMHQYATGSAGQTLRNIIQRGNVAFNNNSISNVHFGSDILHGGFGAGAEVTNGVTDKNYVWRNAGQPCDFALWLGYSGVTGVSLTLTDNYGASTSPIHIYPFTSLINSGNSIYGQGDPGPPTVNVVAVRPNIYEQGRGHVIVYNWDGSSSVSVDLSTILLIGQSYVIHNVQDIFGSPVVSGIYTGSNVSIPMAGIAPPVSIGRVTPGVAPMTGPAFQVFIVRLQGF